MQGQNYSVVRVEKVTAAGAQKNERHNERKNESYANLNVDKERIPLNVHYKDTGGLTYNEYFQKLIDEGKISTRGQKEGATIFNELVVDVNTRYFEERGGYEYAKKFYEEAYRFCCKVYGEENIVSAVMHADELNKAVSEEKGKPVYHYHLHVVAIPTVRKEILWSKRCKDESLRGTVKEVIQQVSHSKKWKNTVPVLGEDGKQLINKYGRPVFRKSYSVLQDELFEHMRDAGFKGFDRGELGSTAEHLSSIEYQVTQEDARLAEKQTALSETQAELVQAKNEVSDVRQELKSTKSELAETETKRDQAEKATAVAEKKLEKAEAKLENRLEAVQKISVTYGEIEAMGKKGMTGKYTVTEEELTTLKTLAEEGVASRPKVAKLQNDLTAAHRQNANLTDRLSNSNKLYKDLKEKYDRLMEMTKPYILALQRFPEEVKKFIDRLLPVHTAPEKTQVRENEMPRPVRQPKKKDEQER